MGPSASFKDKKNVLLQRGSNSGSPSPKHIHYTDSHLRCQRNVPEGNEEDHEIFFCLLLLYNQSITGL